jgi:MFS transporter, FHS family, glucose/mannose:H+ symporter
MKNWQIKLSLFINYFVFAILLNSVGTVILQVQREYHVSQTAASALEGFKDLSIAIFSFLLGAYLVRIGYKRAMLIALAAVTTICLIMPLSGGSFGMTKLLFAVTGFSFALIKMSVYATIGLVTSDSKEHASLMNFIESFFMVGILTGYFIFAAFVSDDKTVQNANWLHVYYVLAALSALAFVLLWTAPLDESSITPIQSKPFVEDFAAMFQLAARPLVLTFVFSAFLYVLIEQSIMSWLPTFNNQILKLPAALSIQMASILAGSTALGRFLAGFVMQKFNWLTVLTICLVSAAILVLLAIPMAKNVISTDVKTWFAAPLAAWIFPLIGLLLAPIYPAINSLILSKLPIQEHATMAGLSVVFSALGGTTGSFITGRLFEKFGGEIAFYGSLVPILGLITCLFFFNRYSQAVQNR